MKKITLIILLSVFLSGTALYSQFDTGNTPEVYVSASPVYEKGYVKFNITVPADHHITDLKHGLFYIKLKEGSPYATGEVVFPEPVDFGDEKVFKGTFDVRVPLKKIKDALFPVKLQFEFAFQMCQEAPTEQCLAPDSKDIYVEITENFLSDQKGFFSRIFDDPEAFLKKELRSRSFAAFFIAFLLGFLTSLTPCIYPVVPIILGYIGAKSSSKLRGFYLSLFIVAGFSLIYTVLGVVAALTGSMVGAAFQSPLVVIFIAAIFIAMGLSMAGFFDIPVPSSISSKMSAGKKGGIAGAFIIGGISGIIAAPCAGPILAILLTWISSTQDITYGFFATLSYSLGMGLIFIVLGTFTGAMSSAPKGGKWMAYVKYFFSILIIGGGIIVISQVAAEWVTLLLWGIYLISVPVFSGLLKPVEGDDDQEILRAKLFKVVLIVILLAGIILFYRGFNMKFFPDKSIRHTDSSALTSGLAVSQQSSLKWFSTVEKGREDAEKRKSIIMIDLAAEWCAACKELDEHTFSDPAVIEKFKTMTLVRLDMTAKSKENDSIRRSLNVIGLPTLIFMNSDGKEIKRVTGFVKPDKFLELLDSLDK